MNLDELLLEAKIKRQFDEVARVKVGSLVYIVKMLRTEMIIDTDKSSRKEIVAITPDIAISLLSSSKREISKEETSKIDDKKISYPRRKAREVFNNLYDRSYHQLSKKEAEKLNAKGAIFELTKVMKDYLDKYNTEYVLVNPYKDGLAKRMGVYEKMLNRLGFTKVYTYPRGNSALYSKTPEKVWGVVDSTIYRKGRPPSDNAIRSNLRVISSNI